MCDGTSVIISWCDSQWPKEGHGVSWRFEPSLKMQILKMILSTVCPRHKHKSPGEIVHPRGAQLSSGRGLRKESPNPSGSSVPDQRDLDQTSVEDMGSKRVSELGCFMGTISDSVVYLPNSYQALTM